MDAVLPEFARLIDRFSDFGLVLVLAFARLMGIMQIFPLFTVTNIQGPKRAFFALAFAVPVAFALEGRLPRELLFSPTILALLAKEFLTGTAIGALAALPFWGVQAAGDLIDFIVGASAANTADPVNANERSITGTLLLQAALAIFVAVGGIQALLGLTYESLILLPPHTFSATVTADAPAVLGGALLRLFTIAVAVGGPALIALAVVDLSLVFGSRVSRQLQVHELSMLVKNLCLAALLPLYGLFMGEYVSAEWRHAVAFLRGVLGGGGG